MPCECNEYEPCGEHLAELERDILHQRSLSAPESDSLEDIAKFAMRYMETPSERFSREQKIYDRLSSGEIIYSRGIRIPFYTDQGEE